MGLFLYLNGNIITRENKYKGIIMYTVYLIENTINSKKYIGETITPLSVRWNGHKSFARSKRPTTMKIIKAMRKYGIENFSIKSIYTTNDIKELHEKEEYYIKLFNSTDHNKGYNILESRHSTKNKIKPVYQYSLDGEFIKEFQSLTEAKNITGAKHISSVANKRNLYLSSGGFLWSYKKLKKLKPHNYKPLYQYSLNNEFIQKFKNIHEAEKHIQCVKRGNHILDCANGNRKTANGFIWRYDLCC
jgi:group I intron endonuclease